MCSLCCIIVTCILIIKLHCYHKFPWFSLSLSLHPSLLFITLCWSSKLHLVSAQNWCKVLACHPMLACPCVGVQRRMSLMSLSLFLQQCPTCLVHFTWIVLEFEGGGYGACVAYWPLIELSIRDFYTGCSSCVNKVMTETGHIGCGPEE